MLLKPFGFTGYLSENEDDGSDAGGGDRGDNLEGGDEELDQEAEVEASGEEGDEAEVEKKKKEAEEAKAKAEADKKAKMVPHARMKEAVEKERKAREKTEAELKEAREKLDSANRGVDLKKLATEIEELDEALDKAIADGNAVEKKRLRGEIREKQMTLARAEAAALSAQATAMAVERVRYDALVERLEKEHPAMNPEHEDYDEEIVKEIVELKEAYEAKGESSSDALKKAAKYVLRTAPVEKKDEVEEESEEDTEAKKKAEEERRAAAVKKAQEAKGRQPASVDKGGKSSDKSGGGMKGNVDKLSDEEFDKLDPKEIARLRGDTV
jgi:hypothetical protein